MYESSFRCVVSVIELRPEFQKLSPEFQKLSPEFQEGLGPFDSFADDTNVLSGQELEIYKNKKLTCTAAPRSERILNLADHHPEGLGYLDKLAEDTNVLSRQKLEI